MSINGKHAYRFVYLKSEEWKTVRVEALARSAAKCEICGEENISNDAHHIYYPESFWQTKVEHLVILCRPCHNVAHALIKNGKKSKEESISEWEAIIKALQIWRAEKSEWMKDPDAVAILCPKQLREAYEHAKEECSRMEMKMRLEKKNPPLVKFIEVSSNAIQDPEKMAPKQLREAYYKVKSQLDQLSLGNTFIEEHYSELLTKAAREEVRKNPFRFRY